LIKLGQKKTSVDPSVSEKKKTCLRVGFWADAGGGARVLEAFSAQLGWMSFLAC
jgi:hypothetical protein